jgi:sugar O-acyltransferase (sialic acid O-acetyltransferase NeuD family)
VSRLLIVGAGGHGRVVADAALCTGLWSEIVASDRDPLRTAGLLIPGVILMPIAGAAGGRVAVHVAVGNAADREKEAMAFAAALATVVHPKAAVSGHTQVSAGCFIAAQAVIAPNARLGRCVIVNHGAVIDHDATVGDYSHIGPLSALGGGARIGRRVLVGAGARVLPGVSVADDALVGAGAVVCDDLPEAGTYVGVPARRIK